MKIDIESICDRLMEMASAWKTERIETAVLLESLQDRIKYLENKIESMNVQLAFKDITLEDRR